MDSHQSRIEHPSIGATALSLIYESLPFTKREKSAEEERDSAKYREFLAEAVGDTAAIIPRYGAVAGGLVRASLLIRPSDSIVENLKSFGGNFAEGATLKKISQMAQPEGYLSTRYTGNFAQLTQGFSFGAAKATFNEDSWYREDGSLSFSRGAYQITSAGLFAGLLNVPLSFVGKKITGAVIDTSVVSGLGARSALVIGGVTSGYGTGFLMGSSNAFLEGKKGLELVSAGNDAGLVSAFTSAAISGLSPIRFSAIEQPSSNDLSRMVKFHSKGRNETPETADDAFRVQPFPRAERQGLSRHRPNLSDYELLKRAGVHQLVTEPQRVLKESTPLGSVPLFSDRAYLYWTTTKENWQQRVYNDALNRMGPMYIKRDYANELDAQLMSGSKVSPELRAAHYIEMQQAFLQTPDPSLIKRVDVRPDMNVHTLWHRRANLDPFMDIAATAKSRTGEITMNIRGKNDAMVPIVDHEWSHLLEPRVPKERALFEVAAALEKKGYYVSDYSKKNSGENWAEHSASFLGRNYDFLEFVHRAPLRAVALSQGMARAAENNVLNGAGATDAGLTNRIQYVQNKIKPAALQDLESRMMSRDQVEASRAVLMYGALAGEKQLDLLHHNTVNNKFLRAASYSALVARIHNDQFKPQGYENVSVANKARDLNKFVSFHLNPKNYSYSRAYAIDGLLNQSQGTNIAPMIGSEHEQLKKFFGDSLYLILK
jgi:hypothetical protein